MTQLRSVTCHMGSHSVTCYPTQANTSRLNPSHTGRYSIYLPRRDGRLSLPSWRDSAPAGSRTSDLSITSPTPNRCTTKRTNDESLFVMLAHHQREDGADISSSGVSCPRRGVHHTSPTDGCIHRLNVGCHRDNIIAIDHSCSAPGQTG